MATDTGSAVESNEVLEKGADYLETEFIEDDNGNPTDISGDTFRAEVRIAPGEPLLASFTFTVYQITFNNELIWVYDRFMDQDVINALTVTEAQWDQFQEFSDGKVAKNFTGKITIPGNITDPTKT
jgi:hypothetical protein